MRKFSNAQNQAVYDLYSSHNPPTEENHLLAAYKRGLSGDTRPTYTATGMTHAAYVAGLDKYAKLFGPVAWPDGKEELGVITDNAIDKVYEVVNDLPAAVALSVLTATIMGTIARCPKPHYRALLAVIAELTNLVRFGDHEGRDGDNVVPLDDWIEKAWGLRRDK